jgi:hypothetical protein
MKKVYAGAGEVWLPDATVSYPTGGKLVGRHAGVVVAASTHMKAADTGIFKKMEEPELKDGTEWGHRVLAWAKKHVDPELLVPRTEWVSVTHNERVNDGHSIQTNRCFGTVGVTANGVFSAVAVANATLTKTATDSSLGTNAGDLTTNEFTTVGLSRATGTVGGFVAASALDGTGSNTVVKDFTVTGAGGTAVGSGLFDSTTVVGSFLYCEDNFSSSAVLVATDHLIVTWTVTF